MAVPAGRQAVTSTPLHVVDSCGWLEYFADGPNAEFFGPPLWDTEHLLVPAITLFEVGRRVLQQRGSAAALKAYKAMTVPRVVQLEPPDLFAVSQMASRYRLALADAVIWQTAQAHGATLYTQDADLQALPGVVYRPKPSSSSSSVALS